MTRTHLHVAVGEVHLEIRLYCRITFTSEMQQSTEASCYL